MVSYPASRRNLSILFAMFDSAKAEARHVAAKSFIFSDQKATSYGVNELGPGVMNSVKLVIAMLR